MVSQSDQLLHQSFQDLQVTIVAELANEKPGEEVLKSLMVATFNNCHFYF